MAREKTISFEMKSLVGVNKGGVLKPGTDGYYEAVVGAFSAYNTSGFFYECDQKTRAIFEESSDFMQRTRNGRIRAENEHPNLSVPGWTEEQQRARAMFIDGRNVVAQFRHFALTDSITDPQGRPVVGVIGFNIPSGPGMEWLEKRYKNPHEDVCFSARFFCDEDPITLHRFPRIILTYDLVNDAGLPSACKWQNPKLQMESGYSMKQHSHPGCAVGSPKDPYQLKIALSQIKPSSQASQAMYMESGAFNDNDLIKAFTVTTTATPSIRVPNSFSI